MALFLKNKTIFLHIPKTGGSWMSRVLYDQGLVSFGIGNKHSDASHFLVPPLGHYSARAWLKYALAVRRIRKEPHQLCYVVRNPFKWYESWFKYQSDPKRNWKDWGRAGDPLDWHPNMELNGLRADDFNSFVDQMIERHPGYVTRLYARYGDLGHAHAFHLETIRDELCAYLDQTGASYSRAAIQSEPDYWVSKQAAITWEPRLRARVAELDVAAFERYGYDRN